MIFEEDVILRSLRVQMKDKNIPVQAVEALSKYTYSNHMGIRRENLESILFQGAFENPAEAEAVINQSKGAPYIYDHFAFEYDNKHYLFQFWIKPFFAVPHPMARIKKETRNEVWAKVMKP